MVKKTIQTAVRWPSIAFFVAVVGVALFFRFYRFTEQWDIFGDAGRDQIVGWVAARTQRIPLSGSFSSSGPFVFGPGYYWFLTLVFTIMPALPLAAQLAFRLIRLLPLLFYWKMGMLAGGRRFAMILTLLALTSSGTVLRDVSLTHHAVAGILSVILVWLLILYIRFVENKTPPARRLAVAFAMGFIFGLGYNIHFFMLNLWPVFLAILVIHRFLFWRIWKEITLMALGFLIPNIPYFWWDQTTHAWANLRNFLDYLLIVQERRYIPNRWLTYLFTFWPSLWSSLVGNARFFGYGIPLIAAVSLLGDGAKRRVKTVTLVLLGVFFIKIILLRFYRGEVYFGYLLTFTPLVLFFSALAMERVFAWHKMVGGLFLTLVLVFNLQGDMQMLNQKIAANSISPVVETVETLTKFYPGKVFTPYVYGVPPEDNSYGLVIMLTQKGLTSDDGMPIGLCVPRCPSVFPEITATKIREVIAISDLRGVDIAKVNADNAHEIPPHPQWKKFTPNAIYSDVAEWWKEKPLSSPFSLRKYLLGKVGL